ncbi:MAG: ATP-dependent Clp protease ATP-binding subunit [Marinilabiliaceae bacterium]|nr:ATP-dependent Clp protease ATP-binding subunit [Marinilabiliaceae bacterium]
MTRHVEEIFELSVKIASHAGHTCVAPEHILLAILSHKENQAFYLLNEMMKIDTDSICKKLILTIKPGFSFGFDETGPIVKEVEPIPTEKITLHESTKVMLEITKLLIQKEQIDKVNTLHLLLAIYSLDNSIAKDILNQFGATYSLLLVYAYDGDDPSMSENKNTTNEEEDEDEDDLLPAKSNQKSNVVQYEKATEATMRSATPALDNFGRDLLKAAEEGRLDPVIGREKEIERMAQILSRRKKNNPILIGEPGVGKSAIAEGLALRIMNKTAPLAIMNKRIVSLDLAMLVAGTKYRGQFEERIKSIINELANHKEIILFIDEIHTIIGAGGASGTLDAANILKPALARGDIQCIGATTLDEYREHIEKDGALERRFQKIMVEPTTKEETLQILHNMKERYEAHHNVIYTDTALKACVDLSDRYITDRHLPDKAMDVLDETGARVHITGVTTPDEVEQIERELDLIRSNKREAVKNQNFELAASFRDREKVLNEQLDAVREEWNKRQAANRITVDADKVEEVVAMMTGIPTQRIAEGESQKLLNMRQTLKNTVIGQDNAIDKIVRAIQRNRTGLKDPNRPIGSFIFLGPTGVGKTHLAKRLAEEMFDNKESLIRIDMSEYMEKYAVSRMVGAPPGYVGYNEGGQLTEKVRRHPYSVVLLDEIEKAHPDIFNILLQMLDDGRLTDSVGRYVDFRNTIIIMTSNIGSRELKDFGKGIGFAQTGRNGEEQQANSIIQKALGKAFAPEFLNRIDDVIIFESLKKEDIVRIVDLELNALFKRINAMGYNIEVTEGAKSILADKSYDPAMGARPLRRTIQKHIEDPLAEMLLEARLKNLTDIVIDEKEGEVEVRIKEQKEVQPLTIPSEVTSE